MWSVGHGGDYRVPALCYGDMGTWRGQCLTQRCSQGPSCPQVIPGRSTPAPLVQTMVPATVGAVAVVTATWRAHRV